MLALALLSITLAQPQYSIVLENGRQVRVADAPELAGKLVTAHLADGTLVSLPLGRVDWPATTRAARAAEEADERAGGAPLRRPKRHATLKLSNKTLKAYQTSSPPDRLDAQGESPSVTQVPGPAKVEPAPRKRVEADDHGHGPEHWAERARLLRDQMRGAESELRAAQKSLAAAQEQLVQGRKVCTGDQRFCFVQYARSAEEQALLHLRVSQLEEKVHDAEARVEEARQREADLREEARRAGADPGWLRLPVAYR